MSVYDNFADAPNQIKIEGQEITINFQRTSDTTARISWNIPPPAQGCSAERRAYDGIVVTISNTPANYISTSPKDGTYYTGDPTGDYDLHAGDKIDKAYVVGAFYHDKTTTFVDIDGIKPKTPYYVSGYAVDSVGRYHREGVHAYSLPTGAQSYTTEDYPAKHTIFIYSQVPIVEKSPTGLAPNTEYTLPIKVECKRFDIKVNGSDAVTYGQLVDKLNEQFAMFGGTFTSPLAPKYNEYFKNGDDVITQWNGYNFTPANYIKSAVDPQNLPLGTFWLHNEELFVLASTGWEIVTNIIQSATPPSELTAYTIWFDGAVVRVWEGGHWCDYNTIISDRNPQLPPDLTVGTYWFDEDNNEMYKWNDILQKWDDALVIYFDKDPNTLNTGDFWYDEKNKKVKRFVGSTWQTTTQIVYADSNELGEFVLPDGMELTDEVYWFDTRLNKLYEKDILLSKFSIELKIVSFPVNPRNRKSCDLWWNSSPSVDDLFVWETLTSTWVPVSVFYRQPADPNTAPLLEEETAWVKDGKVYLLTTQSCDAVNYIYSLTDPRTIVDGTIWVSPSGTYKIYENGEWVDIDNLIVSATDPTALTDGVLWYDTVNIKLFEYVAGVWVEKCLNVNYGVFPSIGYTWFNTTNKVLLEWNGSTWLPVQPFIKVDFVKRACYDNYESLVFYTRKTGCHEAFEIMSIGNTLFESLTNSVIYTDPLEGQDGVDAGPMFQQLGVGDDGSPDERRALHDDIRMAFGHPTTRVELTKQQLDQCINNALLVLRKYSSQSYLKAIFFMDLKPNQQIYALTNRCVGFNKIVDITAIRRTKAGAFRTAYSQNDNFAFAALQQLYTLGTFDMLTFHLTSSYVEELEVLFASRIMYHWAERKRELKLYQVPRSGERVLIEAIIEKPEQELITDRETAYWIKRWAMVEAKSMLAQIRGKFATLPGPSGTTTLNASELQTQLESERTALIEEVQSKAMQDLTGIGMTAHFIIG